MGQKREGSIAKEVSCVFYVSQTKEKYQKGKLLNPVKGSFATITPLYKVKVPAAVFLGYAALSIYYIAIERIQKNTNLH